SPPRDARCPPPPPPPVRTTRSGWRRRARRTRRPGWDGSSLARSSGPRAVRFGSMPDVVTMDKIVSLAKRRGFVFPSSEIYGGLGSAYDYGHYGVLLKE